MSDQGLRTLERAVAAGDAAARLRLAAEYERLGRRDDAIGALVPGADDLEVRRVLGALPAWREPAVRPAAVRFLDAASPAAAPALAWVEPFTPRRGHQGVWDQVLASPLGIVLAGTGAPHHVFDPRTGKAGRELPGLWAQGVVGDVVVCAGEGHRCWTVDLHTGRALHQTRFGGSFTRWGDLLLERARSGAGEGLAAWRFAEPRQPPVPAWRREGPIGPLLFAGRRVAWIHAEERDAVVDPATGLDRLALSGRVAAIDDEGVLEERDGRRALLDPDGRRLWEAPALGTVVALGPDAFVAVSPQERGFAGPRDIPQVVVHDRATGQARWRRGPFARMHALATSLVRDAVHVVTDDALTALELATGQERWRVDLARLGLAGAQRLVPLGRRFYGVAPGPRLFCLRAAP